MIHISYVIPTVEGAVGSKKQKIGTNCTEEESKNKKSVRINNSGFLLPIQNSLLDPAMVVMDLDQHTQDTSNIEIDNI